MGVLYQVLSSMGSCDGLGVAGCWFNIYIAIGCQAELFYAYIAVGLGVVLLGCAHYEDVNREIRMLYEDFNTLSEEQTKLRLQNRGLIAP